MLRYLFVLLTSWTLLTTCQPKTTSDQSPTTEAPTDTAAMTSPEDESGEPAELPVAARQTNEAAFGKPTALDLPKLTQCCQNEYGCLREVLYPLGWSTDGKFIYLRERTNEAVSDYTLDTYVLDATTNTRIDSLQFRASQQAGYREEAEQYTFDEAWEMQEKAIRELVEAYAILPFSGTDLQSPAELSLQIQASNKTKTSLYTGKEVLTSHELKLRADGNSRTIHRQTYGKYDLILGTELLGVFRSPDGSYHALLDAQEQRGFEGPPNVLKLKVIGF